MVLETKFTTMKVLSEYQSIPDTPLSDKKDKGVRQLENELNHEKIYLEALHRENNELDKIISNIDKQLNYLKSNFPQTIVEDASLKLGNPFWVRYESQREANRKLERERKHLEKEIKQIEDNGIVNLDALNRSELILFVKNLERTKTDLTSALRAAEWSLDQEAKDSHHLEHLRHELEAEIRHYDEELAMFRHYNKIGCPSATSKIGIETNQFRPRTISKRIIELSKGPIRKTVAAGKLPSLTLEPEEKLKTKNEKTNRIAEIKNKEEDVIIRVGSHRGFTIQLRVELEDAEQECSTCRQRSDSRSDSQTKE